MHRSGGVPPESLVLGSKTGVESPPNRQGVSRSLPSGSHQIRLASRPKPPRICRIGVSPGWKLGMPVVSFCFFGAQAPQSYATPIQSSRDGVSRGMQRIFDQEFAMKK